MTGLDLVVLGAYFVLIFAIGFDLALWGVLPHAWTLGGAVVVVFALVMSQRAAMAGQGKPSGKT